MPEETESTRFAEARSIAEEETARLQAGSTVPMLGARMPVRTLVALAVFLVAFMVVWVAFWGLAGGLGLALGWIPAAVVGAFAIAVVNRFESGD